MSPLKFRSRTPEEASQRRTKGNFSSTSASIRTSFLICLLQTTQNFLGCLFAPDGAEDAAIKMLSITSFGTALSEK